ncbi:MAG TPA: response regulator [Verrucomicrobiota bacterium]|nr:response regulator [Verrucomicrobiota bacterium]HNT15495.1 response regulator [Verrucomicrobiota bacterium]
MEIRRKVLLVDDDPELLDIYRDTFTELPSKPEVETATTGTKALAMLESGEYRLLVTDLRMPRMDGLQLLAIVRRKWPELRTVVLTSNADERFRSRVYALGVDLYWSKPSSEAEMAQFVECMESLLAREEEPGFRGVQSKSLVDLVQLECISQGSTVLRITNGPFTGHIWVSNGEVVDAETEEVRGEAAFQRILRWKAGNFEFLPAEPARPRTIFKPYNALLLETAQAIDESNHAPEAVETIAPAGPPDSPLTPASGLTALMETDGVEFALKMVADTRIDSRGLNQPELLATWVRQSVNRFRELGESLQAGNLDLITGMGAQQNLTIANKGGTDLCVGWKPDLTAEDLRERMKKIVTLWAS